MRRTANPKRAVVNADDLGFSPGVTEGILRAHREGIVTSTTLAANMPAAPAAVEQLADAPDLGVGVHLNVSQGPVLSDRADLLAGADGGMNRTAVGVIGACIARPGMLDAVEAEFDAQIRWVLDHGVTPTHLDSHRHAHGFPPIFARVARLARRYHIPLVRWCRESLPGPGWPAAPKKQRRNSRILGCLAAVNACIAPQLRASRGTWGVSHTGLIDAAWLILAAERLATGLTEIMVHPGAGDDLDAGQTRLLESRRIELRGLCDPAVKEAFKRHGIQLTHYGKLR